MFRESSFIGPLIACVSMEHKTQLVLVLIAFKDEL